MNGVGYPIDLNGEDPSYFDTAVSDCGDGGYLFTIVDASPTGGLVTFTNAAHIVDTTFCFRVDLIFGNQGVISSKKFKYNVKADGSGSVTVNPSVEDDKLNVQEIGSSDQESSLDESRDSPITASIVSTLPNLYPNPVAIAISGNGNAADYYFEVVGATGADIDANAGKQQGGTSVAVTFPLSTYAAGTTATVTLTVDWSVTGRRVRRDLSETYQDEIDVEVELALTDSGAPVAKILSVTAFTVGGAAVMLL